MPADQATLRVGVKQIDGDRILNDEVKIQAGIVVPRFSIVLVHCQGETPQGEKLRGWASIQAPGRIGIFELLCYHDGPLTDLSGDDAARRLQCTAVRHNDWGHTLRDLGIRAASGDYVMTFNSDNVLYPNALEEISKAIDRPNQIFDPQGRAADSEYDGGVSDSDVGDGAILL